MNVVARVARACAARPWAAVLAGLVLTLASGAFVAGRLAIDTNTYALIAPEAGWRRDEARLRAAFPALQDSILVVVDGATPELAEAGAAALERALSGDRERFVAVSRPDGGAFFARHGLLYAGVGEVRAATARMVEAGPLLGPLAADPSLRGVAGAIATAAGGVADGRADWSRVAAPMAAMADALEARAAGRTAFFSWQRLVGGDGALAAPTRRLVLATPRLDYSALMPGAAATAAVRAAAARLALDGAHGVRVRLTGEVPLSDEEFRSLESNGDVVGIVMALAMVGTLWLALRSGRAVGAVMLTMGAGLLVTAALGLAAVGRFNIISIAFIPLFVGLGIDFAIQLATRFGAERRAGCSPVDAVARAAGGLGPSLLLAAAAVALGFMAFLPTEYVGIAELGIIAGLGMVVALALAVTLLPALLVLLRVPAPPGEVGWRGAAPIDRWLERRRRAVLWAFGASVAVSVALLPWVRFDFNPLHLRDAASEPVATLADLTRDPDRTPNTIDVLAPSLGAADAAAARLGRLPEVRRAVTLSALVPDDQPEKLAVLGAAAAALADTLDPFEVAAAPSDGERVAALRAAAAALGAAARVRPEGAAAAARLARAFGALADADAGARAAAERMLTEPLGVTLAAVRASLAAGSVSIATLPPELSALWVAADGRARVSLVPAGDGADNAVLERFARSVLTVAPHATGAPVTIQAAAGSIARAFVVAGLLALAAISVLLFAVLRSAREVAFTLAPVALAGFLTLSTCVVIGQPINFANIIAFPLLFGVGVAFHIYFVMAWRGGARDLLQTPLARAVFFSALATGTAFGSVWLSAHPGTASMGKILMLSLAWTLVCALVFEPALLGPGRERDDAGSATPPTSNEACDPSATE